MSQIDLVDVQGGQYSTRLSDIREIIIDGVRFSPDSLLALARASGELFFAERDDDVVVLRTIATIDVGGQCGHLVVRRIKP